MWSFRSCLENELNKNKDCVLPLSLKGTNLCSPFKHKQVATCHLLRGRIHVHKEQTCVFCVHECLCLWLCVVKEAGHTRDNKESLPSSCGSNFREPFQ